MRSLILCATVWMAASAVCGRAQNTGERPRFEVASVKALPALGSGSTRSGSGGGPGTADPGRWWAENLTLFNLTVLAYGVAPYQISRPSWMDFARYDVQAKVPPGANKEEMRQMMQTLLEERFHLKYHRETKELAILELVAAKSGPRLRESGSEESDKPMGGMGAANGLVHWHYRKCTIEMLATMLSLDLRMPVIDSTKLSGTYDVEIAWVSERGRAPAEAGPSIFNALQEQLGLKLEPHKGPVEMLVIERADRTPTEND